MNALVTRMRSLSTLRSLPRFVSRRQCRTYSNAAPAASKPYYVTTPIFYPNACESFLLRLTHNCISTSSSTRSCTAPHIGHLHSLVVADIFARYARISNPNRPVQFVTGTDEHGLKIQNAAKAKGMDPLAFCDELSEQFRVSKPHLPLNPQLRHVLQGRISRAKLTSVVRVSAARPKNNTATQ